MPDALAELRALPPRARRQVLARLTAPERAVVERRLEGAAASPAETESVSPWVAAAIAAARADAAGPLAPKARAALLAAADARPRPAEALPARAEPGRSLVEAFGGLMRPRSAR